MSIKTREELEQELDDIKSRLSVIETAQTKPKEETEEPKESEEPNSEVESEDEIEKLLNS